MSTRSVLITGAGGFIGSHLAERCLSLGWSVTAIDAFTDYYAEALKRANVERSMEDPAYTLVDGDLLELDLAALFEGVETIFHLAAQPGVRRSWAEFDRYSRLNLDVTQRLLHAASASAVSRVVVASSSSVYGDAESLPTSEDIPPKPVSPYGVTKVGTEHLAQIYWRNFGLETVCLRYFTVYGPRQRPDMAFNKLITSALADEPFEVYGDGNQTRDFTFVMDAVKGTIAAADRGVAGSVYNIGGGARRSMNSVFESLEALLERPIKREYRDRQMGDARDTGADIERARRELGFSPGFDFATGLKAQLDWQLSLMASVEAAH